MQEIFTSPPSSGCDCGLSPRPRVKHGVTSSWKSGFTLIELSIVLIIISAIIGVVLLGRDLIKAATIRAQIAQIQSYRGAVDIFEEKYDYLPGDIAAAKAAEMGFTTRSGAQYHGDGDGQVVQGCGTVSLGCENALFWNDLSSAKLIDKSFTTATDALVTAAAGTVGSYEPEGKLTGNYIEVQYDNSAYGYTSVDSNIFLLIGATSYAAGLRSHVKIITPQDALSIDSKMDDGLPYFGNVLNWSGAAAPAAGVCVSNASGNPYNTTTNTYANTPACVFIGFKFNTNKRRTLTN